MQDLISRQATIDALAKNMPSLTTPDGTGQFDHDIQVTDEAYVDCMQIIHELPSAEPERKKGEWEEIEVIADAYDISGVKTWASKMMCGQCGFTTIAIEGHFSQYNYCPNCGADMRGGEDDNIVR